MTRLSELAFGSLGQICYCKVHVNSELPQGWGSRSSPPTFAAWIACCKYCRAWIRVAKRCSTLWRMNLNYELVVSEGEEVVLGKTLGFDKQTPKMCSLCSKTRECQPRYIRRIFWELLRIPYYKYAASCAGLSLQAVTLDPIDWPY